MWVFKPFLKILSEGASRRLDRSEFHSFAFKTVKDLPLCLALQTLGMCRNIWELDLRDLLW